MLDVVFSHGKESGPWGTKIRQLSDTAETLGCRVDSLDYRHTVDPDQRVVQLTDYLQDKTPAQTVLVGSSMGGYVTLQAAKNFAAAGVFVLAPAIYMPGYEHTAPRVRIPNLAMVHGWQDDIIPVEHSIRFATDQRCTLHLVDDDHRLIHSLDTLDAWFRHYLQDLLSKL